MQQVLFVGFGGAFGAVSRYLINMLIEKLITTQFPLGVLFVNVLGSFLISILFFIGEDSYVPEHLKTMLSVGFIGAFTTFSTYSLQSFELFRMGNIKLGILNLALNNGLCILFTLLGMMCALFIKMQYNRLM